MPCDLSFMTLNADFEWICFVLDIYTIRHLPFHECASKHPHLIIMDSYFSCMKTFSLLTCVFLLQIVLHTQVLDPSFDDDGIRQLAYDALFEDLPAMTIQEDGRIICAGYDMLDDYQTTDGIVVRLMPDGSFDPDFGNN